MASPDDVSELIQQVLGRGLRRARICGGRSVVGVVYSYPGAAVNQMRSRNPRSRFHWTSSCMVGGAGPAGSGHPPVPRAQVGRGRRAHAPALHPRPARTPAVSHPRSARPSPTSPPGDTGDPRTPGHLRVLPLLPGRRRHALHQQLLPRPQRRRRHGPAPAHRGQAMVKIDPKPSRPTWPPWPTPA